MIFTNSFRKGRILLDALKKILCDHAARYPKMQPADAVKLLYQNEFGGGHLIRDRQKCLDYLNAEYAGVLQSPDALFLEDIGNGLCRVHLRSLDAHGCSAARLGEAFIRSAALHTGNLESFRQKLQLLLLLTKENCLPFSREALASYLAEYEKAHFPMVSHSSIYRQSYAPAYRVVRRDCLTDPDSDTFTESLPCDDESFIDTVGKI